MLLAWSTPPWSDLFEVPVRRRLMVVALLPNASRKAKANSSGSKGTSENAEIASSISTAFIDTPYLTILGRVEVSTQKFSDRVREGSKRFDVCARALLCP